VRCGKPAFNAAIPVGVGGENDDALIAALPMFHLFYQSSRSHWPYSDTARWGRWRLASRMTAVVACDRHRPARQHQS
jgi:hypothetical protein